MAMSPSARKQKGKVFEEKIAKKIHEHLMEYNQEYCNLYNSLGNENLKPKRDFSSGNFNNSDGDIDLGLAKKYVPFSIEAKHHKDLDLTLNAIMNGKISKLEGIWKEQVLPKAEETGLKPLIIFRANRTSDFCFMYFKDLEYSEDFEKLIIIKKYVIITLEDFLHLHISQI
jgi:hypothetical protein